MVEIKPQNLFPYLQEFQANFPVTDQTIFVFKEIIYCNINLEDYYDIYEHELEHLRDQAEYGAEKWIINYITKKEFRLKAELRAYKHQLKIVKRLSKNDKQEITGIMHECAMNISSKLYGNMISYGDAINEFTKYLKGL